MLYYNQRKGNFYNVLEDDSMWNGKKSISLSKLCVLIFMAMLIGTAISAPWITQRFLVFSRADLVGMEIFFLSTIYSGSIPAAVLLFCLYRLLHRIEIEQVFITANVECLRWISWSCFAGAIICLVSVPYYFPWIFVAVAAAFMGLIVRVIKNIVAQAVELKNESDLTV
jgi:hypothetical protein